MQSTIIKKTVKELSHEPTSIQKFVIAFCEMDLDAIEPLISDYESEGNENKYDLLAQLKIDFQTLRADGNTHFTATFGYCAGLCECSRKKTGYRFNSNKTDDDFNIILEENTEGTLDIRNCEKIRSLDELKKWDDFCKNTDIFGRKLKEDTDDGDFIPS